MISDGSIAGAVLLVLGVILACAIVVSFTDRGGPDGPSAA